MAVGLRLDFESLHISDYDAVYQTMNFPADWPDSLLAHGSVEIDGKMRVYDVWESQARLDQFVADRLGAAIGHALGERAEEPKVTEGPFHTFYTR